MGDRSYRGPTSKAGSPSGGKPWVIKITSPLFVSAGGGVILGGLRPDCEEPARNIQMRADPPPSAVPAASQAIPWAAVAGPAAAADVGDHDEPVASLRQQQEAGAQKQKEESHS